MNQKEAGISRPIDHSFIQTEECRLVNGCRLNRQVFFGFVIPRVENLSEPSCSLPLQGACLMRGYSRLCFRIFCLMPPASIISMRKSGKGCDRIANYARYRIPPPSNRFGRYRTKPGKIAQSSNVKNMSVTNGKTER